MENQVILLKIVIRANPNIIREISSLKTLGEVRIDMQIIANPVDLITEIIKKIGKIEEKIIKAIVDQSKEVVAEILQQINPRFEEIENKLEEIKSEIRNIATSNEGEGESEAGGNIEEEQVEQQQQNIQPPLQQNQNRQEAREVVNGRGRARGNSRARNARMFYLLRQLDRERGFNDRYSPFRGNGGGNRRQQRNFYRGY